MKRRIFLSFLMIFLVSTETFGGSYTTQDEIKKIANETQKCIDENYITDYTMAQCVIEGTKRYNLEIEKTVKAAKNYLSKTQYEQFLETQKKWEEFINEHNKLLKQTYEKNCPPYESCLLAAGDKYEYAKNRIEDLSGFIGVLLLLKREGVLDDELNFKPFNY